jgi:hypothetical protein
MHSGMSNVGRYELLVGSSTCLTLVLFCSSDAHDAEKRVDNAMEQLVVKGVRCKHSLSILQVWVPSSLDMVDVNLVQFRFPVSSALSHASANIVSCLCVCRRSSW